MTCSYLRLGRCRRSRIPLRCRRHFQPALWSSMPVPPPGWWSWRRSWGSLLTRRSRPSSQPDVSLRCSSWLGYHRRSVGRPRWCRRGFWKSPLQSDSLVVQENLRGRRSNIAGSELSLIELMHIMGVKISCHYSGEEIQYFVSVDDLWMERYLHSKAKIGLHQTFSDIYTYNCCFNNCISVCCRFIKGPVMHWTIFIEKTFQWNLAWF